MIRSQLLVHFTKNDPKTYIYVRISINPIGITASKYEVTVGLEKDT